MDEIDEGGKISPESQELPLSQFECNICFEEATNPVVTQCGHLYCWCCLSGWLRTGASDCPVCKSSIPTSSIIPLYGRGHAGIIIDSEFVSSKWVPKSSSHIQSESNPNGLSVSMRIRAVLPFVGFTYNLGTTDRDDMNLDDHVRRRRSITQFLIFMGMALIIFVISS